MRKLCLQLGTPFRPARDFLRTLGCEQTGAELFEFALVVPILLTLLLGVIWIGRAYNVYETITRAAREGARYAVLPSSVANSNTYTDSYTTPGSCLSNPTTIFTNYVSPALSASSLDPSKVAGYCEQAVVINPDTDSSVAQCGIEISFQYPVKMAIPFTSLSATTFNISTSVQMRMENQSTTLSGTPTCP